MIQQIATTDTAVDKLSMLAGARQSAPEYFASFLDSDDEVLKVGAWCVLLDRQELRPDQLPQLVMLSKYAAIRMRAFAYLQATWEHELATQVATADLVVSEDEAERRVMDATIRSDPLVATEALRWFFLATGRTDALRTIVRSVEEGSGWAEALPAAVNGVLLAPHDALAATILLALIHQARRVDLLKAALGHFAASDLHAVLQRVFKAAILQIEGDPAGALQEVEEYFNRPPSRPDVNAITQPIATIIRAETLDKLGRYKDAHAAYVALNAIDHGQKIPLDAYAKTILAHIGIKATELPADPRAANHFDMLGFPRSGTTLLENALAAHPRIETFEEVPSMTAVRRYLVSALPEDASPEMVHDVLLEARERYYMELDMARRKEGADIFVDKLPIRSSDAQFLTRLFPAKRYIFSIRHPFDVVLSAFKQHFTPNFAMEHFRRIDTAIRMYDFTMSQWFGVFSLDDPRVHYVRYDALVTDFEPTIRGALGFIGAEWDARVLDFASAAQTRAARTPSYQKVRQGLSIGVQSSWRNYDFLFNTKDAKPLHKWAEFFGYETR